MTLILRLAARNATRNLRRTALTAATVVIGTMMLTITLTWLDGVFGSLEINVARAAGHVRVVQPEYRDREDLMPLYASLQDVDTLVAAARAPAYPRILAPVVLTAGEEIGDVFGLVMGAPLAWFTDRLNVDEHLVLGRALSGDAGEVVLGRSVAESLDATVGATVLILGQTQDGALSPLEATVVGVTHAGNALLDQGVFVPLAQAQWMADLPGAATQLLVYGEHRRRAGAIAAHIRAEPAFDGLVVETWREQEPMASLLKIAGLIKGIISVIIVFITALGVWNTMMMSVLERTGEIGVLRAMGMSAGGSVLLFVAEGLMIAAVGGAIGVTIGGACGVYLEVVGVNLGDKLTVSTPLPINSVMYGDMSVEVAMIGFLLGLATALVGTAVPAWRAAAIQPVDAMRARR